LNIGVRDVDGVGIKKRLTETSLEQEDGELVSEQPSGGYRESHRGGVRQRLALHRDVGPAPASPPATDAASSVDHFVESASAASTSSTMKPLSAELKREWAKGKISSSQLQKFAHNALKQGAVGIEDMSAAGNFGANPGNIFRALKTLFGTPDGAPDIRWIEIPTSAVQQTPHPLLLPHDFLAKMFSGRQRDWEGLLAGAPGACAEFWKAMAATDFVSRHPALSRASWKDTIPIGMHGDGGKFSHQDSLLTITWNSLLGEGQTMQKRFLFTVIRKSDMVDGTLSALMNIFSWSCNAMLKGKFPKVDWANRRVQGGGGALAAGWKAALSQVRGDWQWFCELFTLPQWNSAERMCWLCRASSTIENLAWTRSGLDAGWRATMFTHESYIQHLREAGKVPPVLFTAAIGFRLDCVLIDVLHTVDLGIAAHIIANVFIIVAVVRSKLGGNTYAARVNNMQAKVTEWYRKTKATSRLQGDLTLERLRTDGGWP